VSSSRIRVALVDDQPLFTTGLEMILQAQPDIAVVGTAADGQTGVELVLRDRPDVVLMDLRMPVMNGITAIRSIIAQLGDDAPAAIVLTTIQKDEAVFQALQAGAAAFLTKDARPAEVLDAIRGTVIDQRVARIDATTDLIRQYGDSGSVEAVDELTVREREVALLIARGMSNQELAAALHLGDATVKTHVRAILQKLGLRSRVQIVIAAYESGLVDVGRG
jgi:DNA-binding NarL/FixJ family response regulator